MNNDKKYTLAMTVALTIAVTSIVAFAIVFLNRSKQLPVEKETEFIYTKTLPQADINLLREGIRVTSRKELNALIEDYSS